MMSNGSTVNLVEGSAGLPESNRAGYDPYANRKVTHPTTDGETLVHLLKGSLGSGILAMPSAFANAGLFFGVGATFFVGVVSTYCVNILVQCANHLCQRRKLPSLAFADVAEVAFLEGPKKLQKFAPVARFLVNLFLVLELYGCCCVYIVFVSSNMKQVLDLYIDSSIDVRIYMLCCLPPLLLINMIRNLKYLAPLSMVANICFFMGVAITIYYIVMDIPPISSRLYIAPVTRMPLFFGTVIFALEGIGVVLPLENNMKTPEHFLGCPGILTIGMSIVVFLYTVMGFLGYLKYGADVKGSITLNLPDQILAQSVKVMIAIAVILSYALLLYVLMEIIWKSVKHRFSNKPNLAEFSIRALLVTGTVGIAILVPNLSPFISLIGAVSLSALGLIFPSVTQLVVLWEIPGGFGKGHWILWKNVLIICFGLIGFLTGSYSSLLDIVQNYGTT